MVPWLEGIEAQGQSRHMPACSLIVVQRTQPLSTYEKMNCSKCIPVTLKLKPKPVYRELLWRSNTEQFAPPTPRSFCSVATESCPRV